ncbi:hypothetical protein ACQPXB_40795 [Amycolatopsis sp. CA-161197]|uniref:hypothetical protein n=1 Tax=Amycolatopsis sp. CA-161197 TaxID=3239922 RepID=UPI003D8F68C0
MERITGVVTVQPATIRPLLNKQTAKEARRGKIFAKVIQMTFREALGLPKGDLDQALADARPPAIASPVACLFYKSQISTLKQILYGEFQNQDVLALAKTLDKIQEIVDRDDKFEGKTEENNEFFGETERKALERVAYYKKISTSLAGVQQQMIVTREVDNLLSYLADVASLIHVKRPETLRSGEQVSFEEVLRHGSLEDFVKWATEKRISDLSFKGFQELISYFRKSFAFPADFSAPLWRTLSRAVAIRNILVHRRGVVDERFAKVLKDQDLEIGKTYRLDGSEVVEIVIATHWAVQQVDQWAIEKFAIDTTETNEALWWDPIPVPVRPDPPQTDSDESSKAATAIGD